MLFYEIEFSIINNITQKDNYSIYHKSLLMKIFYFSNKNIFFNCTLFFE